MMLPRHRPSLRGAVALCIAALLATACGSGSVPSAAAPATPNPTPTDVPGATGDPSPPPPSIDPSAQPSPTPEPVILRTTGTATLALTNLPAFVSAGADGTVECVSGRDVAQVDGVSALNLGELDRATVRGSLHPGTGAGDPGAIELFIDGGDLAEGTFQPFWHGGGTFVSEADGVSGRAGFSATLETDPKLPAPDPRWPLVLSGMLTWTCQPWPDPGDSSPSSAP